MSRPSAVIKGVSGWLPEYKLTNKELETMVETTDEWIQSRTGIQERRILKGDNQGTSIIVANAVKDLLEKTKTNPDDVELLIVATVTGDMVFPDTANIVCDMVGINNGFAYDINAACSGFLFALTTGAKFIQAGSHKKVIIAGADKMSSIMDYTDRSTCVIFGDGGGAVLLEASEEEDFGFQDAVLRGDGSGHKYLHMKAGGSRKPTTAETVANKEHYVFQDGRPVFKAAVNGMVNTVKKVIARNNLTIDDVDWLIPHQANKRIITAVGNGLEIPTEKVIVNIQKYGNTTAGTIPLCLWEWQDKFKKGDNIILTAFGGGFTWGAVYLKWGY